MSIEFDFISPTDKPALLGLSTPELQETAKSALDQLGYKIHTAVNHGEFVHKFGQIPYQVVVLEEWFCATKVEENESLLTLQRLPMNRRRHATIVLFGHSMATFNPFQAFLYGVHAVVNPAEMFLLPQLVQKAVADNDMFLHTFYQVANKAA